MRDLPSMEFHMLNFFRVKGDFATTVEMNEDLKKSGLPAGDVGFQKIIDNGYLDISRINNRFQYKINEYGLARWNRLNAQFNAAENEHHGISIQGDIIGSIIGSHDFENVRISPTIQTTKNAPTKNAKAQSVIEKVAWVVGILAGIFAIWEFILKRWLHQS